MILYIKKGFTMNQKERFLKILKDNEWHCAVCDLNESSQPAAIIRDLAKKRM